MDVPGPMMGHYAGRRDDALSKPTIGVCGMKLVVVKTETANIGSVINMCRRIGSDPVVSTDPEVVGDADKIILPGVGAFDTAVQNLRSAGLTEAVLSRARNDVPILGICLGMHLLFDSSEEGAGQGLGLIPGVVRRIPIKAQAGNVSVPHMGWSGLEIVRPHVLTRGLDKESRFYFVHSYAAVPDNTDDIICLSPYGGGFVAGVARGNVIGVQFHPEKSHRHGKAFLSQFLEMA